jgi:hypothetical protein
VLGEHSNTPGIGAGGNGWQGWEGASIG